ncbi:MAG: hypothetical protein IPL72_19025 [Sulfuritalea sp.]|nr:hypothetical protein [Sulfuritalea sp.]
MVRLDNDVAKRQVRRRSSGIAFPRGDRWSPVDQFFTDWFAGTRGAADLSFAGDDGYRVGAQPTVRGGRAIEAVHVQDEQQIALNFAVSHAVLAVNEQYFAKDIPGAAKIITLDLDTVISMLGRIGWASDETRRHLSELDRINAALQREPSRALIGELREELHNLVLHLDRMTSDNHAKKQLSCRNTAKSSIA